MRYLKKFFSFFLILITLFTICGCDRIIILKDTPATITNTNKLGSYVKKMNLDFDKVDFKKKLDEALDKIYVAEEFYDIDEAFYDVLKKLNDLVKKYYVAEALTSYMQDNSDYKEKYENLRDAYFDYQTFLNKAIVEMSKNDEFISSFFAGYSDEDIEFEVNLAKKKQDNTYTELQKELDDLTLEAEKIGINLSDESKDNESLEIMYQFINKNKELASFLGYDSYIEYADIEKNRSYLQDDVDNFINYTKQYLVPLMSDDETFIDVLTKFDTLTYQQQNYFREFAYSSIYDKDYKTINLLNDYARNMGGSYLQTYMKFFNNESYIFADNSDSMNGAYSSNQLCYFGTGNQDCLTVAHEFGHFYSYTNSLLNTKSLDLKEFFSQANEYLFISYLESHSRNNVKDVYKFSSKVRLDEACRTIVMSSAMREFEQRLYNSTLTNKEAIKDIWDNINNNNYNGILRNYWKIEVRYNLYYLSYGTSITGAVGLYNYSKENFRDAKYKYVKAVNNSNMDDDINEVLKNAGLYSPFDEEVFKDLAKLVKEA